MLFVIDHYYFQLQLFHCPLITNLIDLMNAKGLKRLEVLLFGRVSFNLCSFIYIHRPCPTAVYVHALGRFSSGFPSYQLASLYYLRIPNSGLNTMVMNFHALT